MKEERSFESDSATTNSEIIKKELKDVPSVRLSPEQIEEINADEYSLVLFYATRMQPMSLGEIKRQFVETEIKKAESVMERFLKVGLIHKTEEGKFYSNFPNNYINYSNYRYDADLEARKDAKVFQIMKEQSGKKEFWKDKAYFSIDAFYTEEQSEILHEMLNEIKMKAKNFANVNDSKPIKNMKFRRFKFYDMFWGLALFALTFSLGTLHNSAFAHIGGNDPVGVSSVSHQSGSVVALSHFSSGGGNDPTASSVRSDASDNQGGGGGHDPEGSSTKCTVIIKNKIFKGEFNFDESNCVLLNERPNELEVE